MYYELTLASLRVGSYPHIAYDAFLSRVCDEAGVVVVATPYELGTDHGAIAEACQSKLAAGWCAVAAREAGGSTH